MDKTVLNDIGVKHQTDKSTLNHCYLDFYELLFKRFASPTILEIGVQFGNSLRTWQNYFTHSFIRGIDTVDNQIDGDFSLIFGNAYTEQVLTMASDTLYDIIIDDASHELRDQEWFAQNYPHLLTKGGIAIIEDVPGMDAVTNLSKIIKGNPEGFNHAIVDLRGMEVNTRDSILFLIWRK